MLLLSWLSKLPELSFKSLQVDALAGLSVAAMAVPQCVCFAGMAGLPASYGLYGVIAPALGYAFTGSSPYLAVGPVALLSLLMRDRLEPLVPGSESNIDPNHPVDEAAQTRFDAAAIQVALVMGIMLLLLRVVGASIWTNLLSKPIVDSFLTAGALVIAASQVKYLLGLEIPRGSELQVVAMHLWQQITQMRWQELVMGSCWLAILSGQRLLTNIHRQWIWTRPFGSLLVAGLSIGAVFLGDLSSPQHGIRVVGTIQPGPPPWTASSWLPLQLPLMDLLVTAASMTAVSLLEALSIARALADSPCSRPDPAKELLGLGVANVAGAAFAGYPATGSFARSAVAQYAGARTRMAGVVTAMSMMLVLLAATRPFQIMPLNALAAIVIAGVIPLVDFGSLLPLLKHDRADGSVWLVCFIGCCFIGVDVGLALGVLMQLLATMFRLARPTLLSASSRSDMQSQDEAFMELRGPICFMNVLHVLDHLDQQRLANESASGTHTQLQISWRAVTFVDSTGVAEVESWLERSSPHDFRHLHHEHLLPLRMHLKQRGVIDITQEPQQQLCHSSSFETSNLLPTVTTLAR